MLRRMDERGLILFLAREGRVVISIVNWCRCS